jgi:hydroxyacylglutathione hydrolase
LLVIKIITAYYLFKLGAILRMLKIIPVPAFKDNYIWLISNPANSHCVVVDPGDAAPVFEALKKYNLTLEAVLITHHHQDHSGGIDALREKFPGVPVYGSAEEVIHGVDHKLHDHDEINFPTLDLKLRVIEIPGHTLGHIAYFGGGMLFCGDTLFAAGCGRVFEGTFQQMFDSLSKLGGLPDDTLVYCGHEYTAANLKFAAAVEPENKDVQQRIKDVAKLGPQTPTLPSTIRLEKLTNPFLRCHIDSVINSANQQFDAAYGKPVDVFQAVRTWKDTF